MPCALEVTDPRLNSASCVQCNRSIDRNTDNHFSEDPLGDITVPVCPENKDITLVLSLGHNSDWKLSPFWSNTQDINQASYFTPEAGTDRLELLSPQPTILDWLGQTNEKNMHDLVDSSRPLTNGGSTLRPHRHRKKIKKSLTACSPCHGVADNTSRPITAAMISDSDILHDDDEPPKRSTRKKGNKKVKQCGQVTREKLTLSSEFPCEEHTDASSPVEVLLTDSLADKLSETSSSASSLTKEVHLGKDNGDINNEYVEQGTVLNISTLGSDGMDGSECRGSSNETVGEKFSCRGAPYLNDAPNTTDSSEFGGPAVTEHVRSYLGEESNSCQKWLYACVDNSNDATTDSFFNRCNSDNCRDCSVVDGSLTIKDENRCHSLRHGASTGLDNVKQTCHLTEAHLSGTLAEDSNDSFGSNSCCSKDVTDSSNHTERVQCNSEASSSKTSLPLSSGRSSRRSGKASSYSNLTAANRVVGASKHKNNGKDNSASVWQKVEKINKKSISRGGHVVPSVIQDKTALEDTNKVVQLDPTRPVAKHTQCTKSCKQHSPDELVEMGPAKENDALNSCKTFSRCIFKKETPLTYQQTSLSAKKCSSQFSRNYYAPKSGIPKTPKTQSQQKDGSPMQLISAKDASNRSIPLSSLADEFVPAGVVSNSPTEGSGSLQPGVEKAALASVDSYSVPEATSEEARTSVIQEDPHSLCPEKKAIYSDSRNLCAAEVEGTQYLKLTIANTQESCKLYSATGHVSQKWVPVGKKDIIRLDVLETYVTETPVPAYDISVFANVDVETNVLDIPASVDSENCKLAAEVTATSNSSEQLDLKCQTRNETGTAFGKIRDALSDAYRAQQRVEDIQLLIGRPLADFEQFINSASPVLHCGPCTSGRNACSWIKDGLCSRQTADISLNSIWQWYEEPGCYGLEVKAQDIRRSKGLLNSRCQFTTYFVPYLSAVQLFGQPKKTTSGNIHKEADNMDTTSKTFPCMNSLSEQSDQRNSMSALNAKDDQQLESGDGELIFEYFESEQPFWRGQLFNKIKELISGVKQSNCQISGNPKNLELNLRDIHPGSWYCVAWYPIYRIPDGKFQAAFLSYHSLGHWVHRRSLQGETGHTPVMLPVMGLQSYNAKGEWWFQLSHSDSEVVHSAEFPSTQPSLILSDRLSTLKQAAGAMARADVLKKGKMCRNRHPDYEFFLSRYR